MKQFAYIVLTFSLLTIWSIGKSLAADKEIDQIDNLKQNFIPILNGVWVLTDYINKIEETKSPLKSADRLQGVVTMVFKDTPKADSIFVEVSWNNHEGYSFTTYFKRGQNDHSLKTNLTDFDEKSNFYELGFETVNNETFLFLYHYSKTKKLIDKKQFSKVANVQQEDDLAWGIQFIVNKKLFSGNYLLIDSSNSMTNVTFKSDGSLTGDSDLKTYYIFTDFLGGPRTILDGIAFNLNEKNMEWFAFKIEKDTTYLYSTKGDEEAGELLQLDKIKYKLVRK